MVTFQRATRAQQSLRKEEMTQLADNIEIPEVPFSRRILIDHKKALAVIKRAKAKQKSNQNRVQIRNQK